MNSAALEGGFSNPPHQSARAFRAIMNAMARPGQSYEIEGAIPPSPISPAAGTTLLTLCDPDTGIYLAGDFDCDAVREWISFHIGAEIVAPMKADFALGRWEELEPITRYAIGTSEYPDRSTTLIIETRDTDWPTAKLSGPGIADQIEMNLPELEAFQQNNALFPLGADFVFTKGNQISALPRSTEVTSCM